MGLFGNKTSNYLGIDIGVGGIKVTELRNEKGRARLVTYGFSESFPGSDPGNPTDDVKATADLIRQICAKAKVTTTRAVASLPISSVFSSVITVEQQADKAAFDEAVRSQARKLIPVPLEEMVLDFRALPSAEEAADKAAKKAEGAGKEAKAVAGDGKPEGEAAETAPPAKPSTQQVMLTGAAKKMVDKYVAIFKQAGLELHSMETESQPLIRSLVGKDRSTTMIVDIGSVRTNIVIVENSIPYVARSLDMGGNAFTKAMSSTLGMDLKEAEQMKCDIKGVSSIYPGEGLPKLFAETVMPMVTELQYSMNLYAEQGEGSNSKRIERVIVTGGASALPSLIDHLAEQLQVKVYVGDPWARVVYPEGLRPVLDEVGYRFGVSVGLAMREIE
jgi:type IV pilus assembly protein PilM